jgi:hypothetical protein
MLTKYINNDHTIINVYNLFYKINSKYNIRIKMFFIIYHIL